MVEENINSVQTNKNITWTNPYDENVDKYQVISPLINVIEQQMRVIESLYEFQRIITITESDIAQNNEIVKIPDLVAKNLFASVGYRNHLIDVINSINKLNKGADNFIKYYEYSPTPTSFLHYIKNPIGHLRKNVTNLENFNDKNYKCLESNLKSYITLSGSQGLPLLIEEKKFIKQKINKLQEELDKLQEEEYNDWIKHRSEIEKIVEDVKKLESRRDFNKEDLEDLAKQIDDMKEVRGKLVRMDLDAKSNRLMFFLFYKDYKSKINKANENIELMVPQQEKQRKEFIDLAGKAIKLKEIKVTLEEEFRKMDENHENRMKKKEDEIKSLKESYEKISIKIKEMCDKTGSALISEAIKLLEAVSCRTQQDSNITNYYKLACEPIDTLLTTVESHLQTIETISGEKESEKKLCNKIINGIDESLIPLKYVVQKIKPAFTKSLQGESLDYSVIKDGVSSKQISHS
ncbi:15671_t:CDS:2 [Funneliformis geosporum]|uniref:5978_t:CDS:1 n=1 Tax=Funneliformis geosporum TaxID=1117311 RepID=A0A9W4WQ19_9GLOM|nr:15671_t:CDS:2 [Funneliformis geosporum]CAI2178493.1 5978_t:CDS:2 [Funneliformis geosporum]